MDRANKLTCPNCGTALKSARGVRIGRKIKCLKCAVAFTVRPEDAERAAAVNKGRLVVAVCGTLLCLLGGAALTVYCFALDRSPPANTQAAVEDDLPEPPSLPPRKGTVTVSAAEQRRSDNAIAKGVWYLREHQLPSGTWSDTLQPCSGGAGLSVAFAALPALTLLECGVSIDDPIVQKAADLVRKQARCRHPTGTPTSWPWPSCSWTAWARNKTRS